MCIQVKHPIEITVSKSENILTLKGTLEVKNYLILRIWLTELHFIFLLYHFGAVSLGEKFWSIAKLLRGNSSWFQVEESRQQTPSETWCRVLSQRSICRVICHIREADELFFKISSVGHSMCWISEWNKTNIAHKKCIKETMTGVSDSWLYAALYWLEMCFRWWEYAAEKIWIVHSNVRPKQFATIMS